MTTSSPERAQRLPRDLALIALVIKIGLAAIGIGAQLTLVPNADQMRRLYSAVEFLVPMTSMTLVNWVFATLLVWCFARHALDRHGPDGLARPGSARVIFGVVFLLLVSVQAYVLMPLFQVAAITFVQNRAMPMSSAVYVFALSSVWQLALLALFAWFACWLALRPRPGGDAAVATSSQSPRTAIAWTVGLFFMCLQMLMSSLFAGQLRASPDVGLVPVLLGWVLAPLAILGLTFWGAWMGARGASQLRPLRAIGASALAFVLLQAICIGLAIAWIVGVVRPGLVDNIVAPMVGLALLYVVLMVVLTRAMVRGLYRRYL